MFTGVEVNMDVKRWFVGFVLLALLGGCPVGIATTTVTAVMTNTDVDVVKGRVRCDDMEETFSIAKE